MSTSSTRRPNLRRTRIVCISDTHNQTPKLPAGDVLIHAGDLTNQGSYSELKKTVSWLEKADFELKIVVAGNHDVTLDEPFYEEHKHYFHNQAPEDSSRCKYLLKGSPTITYLEHESREFTLWSESGPRTKFKLFGSPYSPAQGTWAFQYAEGQAQEIWDKIPLDTDIVVTHAPPYNHCDYSSTPSTRRSKGCEALRKALWRVRPKLAVCGHTHEGRGAERVRWKLDLPFAPFLEESTTQWIDPGRGNNKQSLVDLSARSGNPLDHHQPSKPSVRKNSVSFSPGPAAPTPDEARTTFPRRHNGIRKQELKGDGVASATPELDDTIEELSRLHAYHVSAIQGRLGRKESCIVNASIKAHSWGQASRRYNKPIVVDLDLPVWDDT